jgi:hypothetical protein
MPACGANDEQGRDVDTFSSSSTRQQDPPTGDEGRGGLRALSLSAFLSPSLSCNPRLPLAYERGSWAPHKGQGSRHLSSQKPFESNSTPFRDLEPSPSLSPICNPYYKLSAGNTSSHELDVGTFSPNQYNFLCHPSTLSEPNVQIQIYLSAVRNTDSWRTR